MQQGSLAPFIKRNFLQVLHELVHISQQGFMGEVAGKRLFHCQIVLVGNDTLVHDGKEVFQGPLAFFQIDR